MSIIGDKGSSGGSVTTVINNITQNTFSDNQLVSGSAAWISGLTFAVTDCTIQVAGVTYQAAGGNVTLATADGTHPRIDVVVAQTDGTVSKVTGTAAASPTKPEIDPNTQVEVTFVIVSAAASTPDDIVNTSVYAENTEWTSAVSANVDAADTSDPNGGTKAILFNSATNGNYVTLTDSSSHDPSAVDRVIMYVKNVAATNNRNRLRIALYDTDTRVSNWIDLRDGIFGYSSDNVSTYHFVQIPMTDFAPNASSFNRIRIEVNASGSNALQVLIDDISLQSGAPTTDLADFALLSRHNVWRKAQGSGIEVLTDAATISWDMALGNVFQVTLDGNRTMAAPTNVKPGYTYILFVYQDATTGSRTISWNSVFKWADATAPTLATGTSDVDVLSFVADASGNLHGTLGITNSS